MKRETKDRRWIGKPAVDANGHRVGTVDALLDVRDEWPALALVALGPEAGDHVVAVPAARAVVGRAEVRLPYLREELLRGPQAAAEGRSVDDDLADRAVAHFDGTAEGGLAAAPDAMTVSEEQLEVGLVTVAAERAVIRKVVVEEDVELRVRLRREELRVERDPVPEDLRADLTPDVEPDFDDPVDRPVEFVLYGEQPVVGTRIVPVERVRLGKETVTEERVLEDTVRRERVAVERLAPDDRPAQPSTEL